MKPTIYNEEIVEKICLEVATTSKSLKSVCADIGLHPQTVLLWLRQYPDFYDRYYAAKAEQSDLMIEEMLEIADDSSQDAIIDENGKRIENKEFINRSRLRVDTRKWIASKLKPKKYGDRADLNIRTYNKPFDLSATIKNFMLDAGNSETETGD